MKRSAALALCLAPQLLVFAGMIAREELVLQRGIEVELLVLPRDPMDLMRGRYLAIEVAIARLDLNVIPSAPDLQADENDEVYVKLRRGERFWEAASVSRDLPPPSEAPYLRGAISSIDSSEGKHELLVDFGLNQYFIPQEAHDPSLWTDNEADRHVLSIRARVDERGRALIEDLYVDGRPFAEWNHAQ